MEMYVLALVVYLLLFVTAILVTRFLKSRTAGVRQNFSDKVKEQVREGFLTGPDVITSID